jgi:hypothetical protein
MELIPAPGTLRVPEDAVRIAAGDGADYIPDQDWFDRRRTGFGASTLALRIGPLRLRLEGLGRTQHDILGERYRPFLDGKPAAGGHADLVIRLAPAGVPGFLALPPSGGEVYRMGRRARAGWEDFWSYEFAGTFAPSRGEAELALVESAGPLFDRGVENFLRPLLALAILERGGMLLHGAGVVSHGRAHVFFGPSGSGKTTVTHLSPGHVILSDDLTLVIAVDGDYHAAGIPFGMAHHHVPETNEAYPIAGLHRLVQSSQVRRQRMSGAEALAEVVACMPFVNGDARRSARALEVAAGLLGRVRTGRLHFRKDDSFWTILEEAA